MAKQTFTTGQVLTAAQMTSLQQTAMGGGSATTKTASYTLVAADAGTTVTMTSASATTITVNTSLFAAGDTVYIQNLGSGVSTITAGTATVNTSATLALAQYEGGQLYFVSTSASIFLKGQGAAAASGPTYAVFNDTKSSGTGGGTFTSGAFRTRDINTTVFNGITGASIASNQITLAAGTYYVDANAPAYQVNNHVTRLQNITDSTTTLTGSCVQSDTSAVSNISTFMGAFTIASSKTFEVQHRAVGTFASTGFGLQTSFSDCVYTQITVIKVA
jgi:hypothetical protein